MKTIDEVMRRLMEVSDTTVSVDNVTRETSLREDLGLNSLQAVDLVMDLENAFSITIEDEELENLETVGDIISLVESKKK